MLNGVLGCIDIYIANAYTHILRTKMSVKRRNTTITTTTTNNNNKSRKTREEPYKTPLSVEEIRAQKKREAADRRNAINRDRTARKRAEKQRMAELRLLNKDFYRMDSLEEREAERLIQQKRGTYDPQTDPDYLLKVHLMKKQQKKDEKEELLRWMEEKKDTLMDHYVNKEPEIVEAIKKFRAEPCNNANSTHADDCIARAFLTLAKSLIDAKEQFIHELRCTTNYNYTSMCC